MVTSDFMDLARLGENVDILIDVTGVPVVRKACASICRNPATTIR